MHAGVPAADNRVLAGTGCRGGIDPPMMRLCARGGARLRYVCVLAGVRLRDEVSPVACVQRGGVVASTTRSKGVDDMGWMWMQESVVFNGRCMVFGRGSATGGLMLAMVLSACLCAAWSASASASERATAGSPAGGVVVDDADDAGLDEMLSRERWREHSFGVSLRPPIGSRIVTATGAAAVMRMELPEHRAVMTLSIHRSPVEMDLFQLAQMVIRQVGVVQVQAAFDRKRLNPGGRPGLIMYFNVPREHKQPRIMAQAFMQMDAKSVVNLRMDLVRDPKTWDEAKGLFEAVFSSLRIASQREIEERRRSLINAGDLWLQSVTAAQLREAATGEQFFRLQKDGHDVGWMYKRMEPEVQELGLSGVAVVTHLRMHLMDEGDEGGKRALDSQSRYFLSLSGSDEVWDIRMTLRPLSTTPGVRSRGEVLSYAETGVRGPQRQPAEAGVKVQSVITVTRQSLGENNNVHNPIQPHSRDPLQHTSGLDVKQWGQPGEAYLPQVTRELLPELLPHRNERELGFYCYHPSSGRITFRTERIVPEAEGDGFTIRSRVAPDQPEQVSRYDSRGRLVEQVLPDGTRIIPATLNEIRQVWRDVLPDVNRMRGGRR